MSYEIYKVKAIKVYEEPAGQYAIKHDITASDWLPVMTSEATIGLALEQLANETMMQRLDAKLPSVNGRKRSAMTATTYFDSTTTPAIVNVTQSHSVNGVILKAIMGGKYYSEGSTFIELSGGPYNSGSFFTNYSGTRPMAIGSVIGIMNPVTNQMETRQVAQSLFSGSFTGSLPGADSAIVPDQLFSFTPTSGSIVYGSETIYLTQDPDTTLQFHVQGRELDDTWYVCGLNGGFALATEIGALPTFTYTMEGGATWFTGSNATALAEQTYLDQKPIPFVQGNISVFEQISNYTLPSYTCLTVKGIEWSTNIEYVPVTSVCGVNNIERMRRNRTAPVMTGKFTTYYKDRTWFDYREAGTSLRIRHQTGGQPGNTLVTCCPNIRITDVVLVDSDGLSAQEVTFECYESLVDSTFFPAPPQQPATGMTTVEFTDLARSAFVISRL